MKRTLLTLLLAALVLTPVAQGHPRPFPKWWLKGALCIHDHEGSWRDAGAPHWGGLQFDMGFQRTYGPGLLKRLGTADKWPPHAQLHVAYRAYFGWRGIEGRQWGPWPNTRRMCGI